MTVSRLREGIDCGQSKIYRRIDWIGFRRDEERSVVVNLFLESRSRVSSRIVN